MDFFQGTTAYHKLSTSIRCQVVIYEINYTQVLHPNDGNYWCIPPTLDGWVYIDPIHGPLDGPLNTWAQYTPTEFIV